MRVLLDTHLLLWAADEVDRLPAAATDLLADPDVDAWFSAASIWEIAIKRGLDRPDFRVDAGVFRRALLRAGFVELAVTGAHAAAVALLPPVHRDPFDRLLVAQAATEGITLVTHDEVVGRYPGPVRVV
ncbi:type II toxin-antitoxin system VapC family toxin [Cellulosimicrobium marinum]|uniref:type II toxin-antitoxin system VapC family toxin n=1 Tax=Cellulosimicrobium marinum TaxID=1638992 RepID=UPI001E630343|nr:type II toxin-antitoxin system VapC family toxin [Cellulosimicrobium marinum]MCB7135145.1 type II toxin-antitoxin system VapC family toxin [Cellulosimicrobium marinum]